MEKQEICCWNCEFCEWDTNCCVVPDRSLCPFVIESQKDDDLKK